MRSAASYSRAMPAESARGPVMSQQVHAIDLAMGRGDSDALAAARAFEARARPVVQSLTGKYAWKTVALFLGILAGVSGVAALTVNGYLSYWVAVPINAVLIYFIFTPLHEAVVRAVTAFECGAIVNPEHLRSQIEGAVIMGLGGALFEWIDFRDGKILNPSFSRYRVPRFADVPVLETVMINRTDIPSAGAGEAPIYGIAPAIRNAIVNATGKRLYTLPLVPNGLRV